MAAVQSVWGGAKAFIYHDEGGKLCQFSEPQWCFFFFLLMSSTGKKHVICVSFNKTLLE